MESVGSSEKKPMELFVKWSEEYLDLLNRRHRVFKETTESFLDVVRDAFEMKVPEDSMKRLSGNVLELCSLPVNSLGSNGKWEEVSREFQKLLTGMPVPLSGNGLSEEIRQYGKATCSNGSRASLAGMNWMKGLLHEQKIASDSKEAGQVVKNCLEMTESFIEESVACLMDQVKANSGLVKTGLLNNPAGSVR